MQVAVPASASVEAARAAFPKILGLTVFGAPFDARSWSGSTRSLFSALQARGTLVEAQSVDLTIIQKLLSAARHPALNRRRLYLNVMKSGLSFESRSENARRVFEHTRQNYNVILQLGALFLPPASKGVLHCSYHDGNTAVSRRSEFSYVKASRRALAESWRNEQHFYRHVNLVFTMSEWLRESMINDFGVAPENVIAVGAGPNLSYAGQLMDSPRAARNYENKTILFVGVDFEGKGGPTILDAFRRVRREIPSAKLRIVGCNVKLNEPGVEVVGILDKSDPQQENRLRQIFDEASLFALPTCFDCFGIAFVEAMYHSLPCIGSNICAIPELIHDGETGFTLPPQDASQWADKIILLLRDERLAQQMSDRAFGHATSRYRWDLVVDRMLKSIAGRLR